MQYRFGWKPDLPDHRDFKYSAHKEKLQLVALPPSVDLRPKMSKVEDQGNLGSCVAHATVGSLEFLQLFEIANHSPGPEQFGNLFVDLSRMFVYANARILDGDLGEDGGTQIRSAVKAIRRWGICREILWPYNENAVFSHPSIPSYQEGKKHLIPTAYRVDNSHAEEIKTSLAAGFPVIYGQSVFESFMSNDVRTTGIVPYPSMSESLLGGHALCIVGYDDAHKYFIVRNSWSPLWGDNGYCYIGYDYITNIDLARDFWTLRT